MKRRSFLGSLGSSALSAAPWPAPGLLRRRPVAGLGGLARGLSRHEGLLVDNCHALLAALDGVKAKR